MKTIFTISSNTSTHHTEKKRACQIILCCILTLVFVFASNPSSCQDLRILQEKAKLQEQEKEQQLEHQAASERAAAAAEAKKSREQIISDKRTLKEKVASLKKEIETLQKDIRGLESENNKLGTKEKELDEELSKAEDNIGETLGTIRSNSKDVHSLITEDLHAGIQNPDLSFLEGIAAQTQFPGLDDLQHMIDLLFDTMRADSEVSLTPGAIIDRQGHTQHADILTIGCFSALYRLKNEVGFLKYSSAGRNLYALSKLPSHGIRSKIKKYFAGESPFAPVDITKGAALIQIAHSLSFWQEIFQGGLLVWPIIAIFCCAIILVIERIITLHRRYFNGERLLAKIEEQFRNNSPKNIFQLPEMVLQKPLVRILNSGMQSIDQPQEEIENTLQEAILKEIPPLERFLATLSMLAAIAPLLGLLGTVTGMIDTFQVITQFGTGDPKLMSGGISVALVTTMLGLMVAIPIMFAHTLLNRSVENHIGELEEKSISFLNIVLKYRG